MSLAKFRKEIEQINSQILRILAKRNKISKKVGKYKKQYGLKITDKKKEKEIFSKIRKQSKKLGLNQKFAEDIFKRIIKESKRLQK
jgi:chorismate mutase